MRTVALASGSNGNAIYVETADVRLLFDAGLSGKALAVRARARGVDLSRLDALLLSHNHADHVAGAGVIHRRYGVPLRASRGTYRAVRGRIGRVEAFHRFSAGSVLRYGGTLVHTLPTPHDGRDGVAFVVEEAGVRLGILTDLGHPFPALADVLPTLDAAYLEANYDEEMLEFGPYPRNLKERIRGPGGHLSNAECAALASAAAAGGRLRVVVLSHLSGENNDPGTALAAAAPLRAAGLDVRVAPRHAPSDLLDLESGGGRP